MAQADADESFEYDGDGDSEDFEPASAEAYAEATTDTTTVDLQHGPGAFRIRTIPPLRLIRDAERFGVSALLGAGGDEVDMGELISDGDLNGFLDETVVPNVLEPTAYWGHPPDDAADDPFDLAGLHPEDLQAVIMGLVDVDEAQIQERMDDRFPG